MGNITGKEESLIDGGYPLPISKLYNKTDCDLRIVRKFIVDRKLSPFYKGLPDSTDIYDTECPICFLYYPSNLNLSRCCKQPICTECFLQIKHPASGGPASCPFCVEPEYGIIYKDPSLKSPKNEKEKEKEEKIVSVPHTSPSVVQIDSIRPNGRKPVPVLEPVQTSTRRMTISGRPTNRHRRSQHGPSSFTQESTISNSQFPTASRRATSDTLFAVQDVESEMERIMIMEAIRLSLISQRERERERENEMDSLDESLENETEQRSEAKDEPNPPRATIDMGTSV